MWLETELRRNNVGFSSLSFCVVCICHSKLVTGGAALAIFGRFALRLPLQTFFQWNKCDSKKMTVMKAERRSWRQNGSVWTETFCSASVFLSGKRGKKKKKLVFSHHRDVCLWRGGAAVFNYGAIKKWNIFKILEITVFVFRATTWQHLSWYNDPTSPAAKCFL